MAGNPMQQFSVHKIGPEINFGGVDLSFTRNLGARWAPISSWWPSATLLALRAFLTSSFTPFGHSSRVTRADDKFTSVLEQVRFQERGEQCHFGSFWTILGHFGPFWVILGHLGPFWVILSHFGPFWVILGHFGPFWVIWLNFGCKSIIFTVL